MNINLEQVILRNILTDDEYTRKVLPFIKPEYFEGIYRILFRETAKFVTKYNKLPTAEAFKIELDASDRLNGENYTVAMDLIPQLFAVEETDSEWLIQNTEKWCQDRAIYNAVMESISIIDGKHETMTKGALPDLLSKALGVAFDTNVGHDYIDNVEDRWDFYNKQEERIPFDLEHFNTITKGGVPNKTLNIALAGTGVGKSLFMCHVASSALTDGKNVLYITMEMAEERIAERIDANLLNVPIDQLETMPKTMFTEKVKQLSSARQVGVFVGLWAPTFGILANVILMTSLFVLLFMTLGLSLWMDLSDGSLDGALFMFTVDPAMLSEPEVWINGLSQSAWSCSAGMGMAITYAVYMRKDRGYCTQCFHNGIGEQ